MDEWLDLDELIEKTEELVEFGLHDDALAMLDKYSPIYTESWELCAIYGRIHTDQDRPEKAIPYLKRGLHLSRNNPDCLLGLFYAYTMLHEIERGGKYLLRAERHHPDNEMVQTALIWYYTEINDLNQAIAMFEKLQKNGSVNPEAFRNVAIAYQRSGMYENAEHAFRIALELNPGYEEVRDLLADLYMYIDQGDKAVELYEEVLKQSPHNIRVMSKLVFCHTQSNDIEKATSLAKESIRLYPNSPVGYIDLSYVYLNSGKPELAVEYADKAHDVSPFDAEAYRIKGIAWSEIGNWEQGRASFTKALELDPDNTDIMRDFYHHLRSEGDGTTMESLVNRVIKIEYPYCIEDFWFLADYYRETGDDLKSFHYLKQAFRTMPGEQELIPPMLDIMLEHGHAMRAIPFIMQYVSHSGWNDTMNEFSRHQRFRGKNGQEWMRFLRFMGERPQAFRMYLFRRSVFRYLFISLSIIICGLACILWFSFGAASALATVIIYLAATALFFVVRFLRNRFRSPPSQNTDTATESPEDTQ